MSGGCTKLLTSFDPNDTDNEDTSLYTLTASGLASIRDCPSEILVITHYCRNNSCYRKDMIVWQYK